MSTSQGPTEQHHEPDQYEIRIKGHLTQRWADWFDGLTITLEANGETVLTGPIVDQPALYGLLRKVRDLGLPLISVMQVESIPGIAPDNNTDSEDSQSTKGTNS